MQAAPQLLIVILNYAALDARCSCNSESASVLLIVIHHHIEAAGVYCSVNRGGYYDLILTGLVDILLDGGVIFVLLDRTCRLGALMPHDFKVARRDSLIAITALLVLD